MEDAVASWETYDTNLDEQYHRDFVLKQPSASGPWVALGLGITLLAFLGSLVYMNVILPPSTVSSPEARAKHTSQHALERRKPAITVIPPGRAPHAFLGGQGPALPPEHGAHGGPP